MRTKEDITKILRTNRSKLLKKYPIKEIALFGSYSRDEQKEDSDIDIIGEAANKISGDVH